MCDYYEELLPRIELAINVLRKPGSKYGVKKEDILKHFEEEMKLSLEACVASGKIVEANGRYKVAKVSKPKKKKTEHKE